jgi:hypothetical protein
MQISWKYLIDMLLVVFINSVKQSHRYLCQQIC